MEKRIDTRDIVLGILMDIQVNNTFSNIALTKALRQNQFSDKADRAFITRLAEGTVESMITLDYIIDSYSKTKVKKCKAAIANILRMGTYQIMYMDKVPDSAACNESVKLARKHGFAGLSGFVNGVLRSIARNKDNISFPDKSKGSLYYSVKYSMPQWLCEKLMTDYPDKFEDIFTGCFEDRKTTIRVNETKTSVETLKTLLISKGVEVSCGNYDQKALLIDNYDFIRKLPGYREGFFSVQDESSMCAIRAAGIKPGDIVIDVCAAPGGKTTLAAEYLNGEGKVYSMDISSEKMEITRENAERLGLLDNVEISVHDAADKMPELFEKADVVICDVPCSGLGIIGRKNDIKYHLDEKQFESLIELQRQIIANAIKYVKKGGKLLFSTCTINPDENQKNREWILDNTEAVKLCSEKLFIQGVDKCDGFYYAVFCRE